MYKFQLILKKIDPLPISMSDFILFRSERAKFFSMLEKLPLDEKLLLINLLPDNLPFPFFTSIPDRLLSCLLEEKNFEIAKCILETILDKSGSMVVYKFIYQEILKGAHQKEDGSYDWRLYDYFIEITPRKVLNYCRGQKPG